MVLPDPGTSIDEDTGTVAPLGGERPDRRGGRSACEGRDADARGAGEATVGRVEAVLEPALLDLYAECYVSLSERCREWVEGRSRHVGETAAREAERCLRAAEDAYAGALADSLDDQLEAVGAREGVEHRPARVKPLCTPNALQCAGRILDCCYDAPCGRRVLWRALVDPTSTAERVRVEIRSREGNAAPVVVEIETTFAALLVEGERTTYAHDGDAEHLRTLGETVTERVRAVVTASRRRLHG